MATGTVFAWATGIVIGRGIHEDTPPIGMSFWRWLVPAICLLPWVIQNLKKEGRVFLTAWKPISAMGIFMVGRSPNFHWYFTSNLRARLKTFLN